MKLLRQRLGTFLGLVVAAYLAFYLVQTVKHNYELQQQITGLQQDVATLQAQRDQLKYQIQYYQTDSYQEKQARAKLGLQQPGESVIIIPHSSEQQSTQSKQNTKAEPKKSHWQQWMDFLFGRS